MSGSAVDEFEKVGVEPVLFGDGEAVVPPS
jgi:hypothetical protein